MGKRFTCTSKWDKRWFRKLSPKMKCAWIFMLDQCDHAGIMDFDLESFEYYIGEPISMDEFLITFKDEVDFYHDQILIKEFVNFQYGPLKNENRVHQSVISKLEKLGPCKDLTSPLQRAKYKDKDKYKEKDKEKNKDKNKEKEKEIVVAQESLIPDIVENFNNSHLVALYCDNWKKVYKSSMNPIFTKEEIGRLQNFLKANGPEKSKLIVNTFFKMADKWFLTKKHDVHTMLTNTNSIIHFHETGKLVTNRELNTLEKNISNENMIDDIERNGI